LKYSQIIVTASHCLTNYKKDSGNLRFIIKNSHGEMVQKIAYLLLDSKYSSKELKTNSDYAILMLDSAISNRDVSPFIIQKESFTQLQKKNRNNFASLAGFSGDIGDFGAILSYDPKCKLNYYSKTYGASNCSGFKGASGGAVVLTIKNNNIETSHLVGIVSHFKKKSYQKIFFAPHHLFYKDLLLFIHKYNY